MLNDAISAIELLRKAWEFIQGRRDPVRMQAARVIYAFGHHEVARQQIPRLLPDSISIPTISFSTARNLTPHVTPKLLDWTAALLVLNRGWLDCVSEHPHRLVDGYKNPRVYFDWLAERIKTNQPELRVLHILSADRPVSRQHSGPFAAVLEETIGTLDEADVSRYWRFSDGWFSAHPPSVTNLLALCAVAEHFRILIRGRVVPERAINQFESGRIFASTLIKRARSIWYPEDLFKDSRDEGWRNAHERDLVELLMKDGLADLIRPMCGGKL